MSYIKEGKIDRKIFNTGNNSRRKRKFIAVISVLVMIVSIVSAVTYFDVIINWIIPDKLPHIVLLSPSDNSTVSSNPIQFNWSSWDVDHDILTHIWYCDISPTFISPYHISVDVGSNTSYNYTLDDGCWYWKVSVTDNDGINTTEVWRLIVGENISNNFPSLSNPDVSPDNGYTNKTYTYNVTFTDMDNNTPAYVRVYIDGIFFIMTETNSSDINTVDGKEYTYSTLLSVGIHNYTFICSDGDAINITDLYIGPNVTSTPPIQTGVVPYDGSLNITINPGLYVNCSDYDNDMMTASWWWLNGSIWYQFASNTSFGNMNITQTNANFSQYNNTYTWSLNLTDGISWVNNTYIFTTVAIWINNCPVSSNPIPANNSIGVNINVGYWNITIIDPDGNLTSGSIECSCGNSTIWNSVGDGIKSLGINQTLIYGTMFTVWLNYTDGGCFKNETYYFSTLSLIIISNIYPANDSYGINIQPVLYFTVNHSYGYMMNISWYYGIDNISMFLLGSDSNITNSTVSMLDFNASHMSTLYYWKVVINDGAYYLNETYHFWTQGITSVMINPGVGGSAGIVGIVGIVGLLGFIFGMNRRKRKKHEVIRETITFYRG